MVLKSASEYLLEDMYTALDIIWLDDSASGKRELVGGKAANLNQLHSGGQVPCGFCITDVTHRPLGMGCFAPLSMTSAGLLLHRVMLSEAKRSRSISILPTPSVRSGRCVTSVV